jgi:uncharacterized protein (TIGR03437 family)
MFTVGNTGAGQATVLNEDGTPNSPANPAARGSVISIFGTGGGQTSPAFADGQIVPGPAVAQRFGTVTIEGASAPVLYAGAAPSLVAGVLQVNAQVPAGIDPGPNIPILFFVDNGVDLFQSPDGVTIAVK